MEKKLFDRAAEWRSAVPVPVLETAPELVELYWKAWALAHDHVKALPGMPQTPYMDEAFCESQIWIWDSCFMSLFCKYAQDRFPGIETLRNFYLPLYEGVSLPLVRADNDPAWTRVIPGRKTRLKIHIFDNPPLFAWAELQNGYFHGDRDYVSRLLCGEGYLQKHFARLEMVHRGERIPGVASEICWERHELGYFWEGGRSGMDNSPRGRTGAHAEADRPNHPEMLWLDAICQQAFSAQCIARLARIIENREAERHWEAEFHRLALLVNENYWDEQDGFYYDIHARERTFFRVRTIASFWPLIAGIADRVRAERLMKYLEDATEFGGEIPCVSLSRSDTDFNGETGEYWRGSLWVPTAYMTIKGLERYGNFELAHSLSRRILNHMSRTFREYAPHTIWECYNPNRPEPARSCDENGRIVRPDFCGWSALAPIGLLLEDVIGVYSVDAFENRVKWRVPEGIPGKIGVRNLRFGDAVCSLEADGGVIQVESNRSFHLEINGMERKIPEGGTPCVFRLTVKK